MTVRLLSTAADLQAYDAWVRKHPQGSLWQSLAWRDLQKALGRDVRIYVGEEGSRIISSALVVIDRTVFGLSTWEIPRGPLQIDNEQLRIDNSFLLHHITRDAKKDGVIALYFSPLTPIFNYQLSTINSARHVHPKATRILDLTLSEDNLLNQMKPKGRYNIRLAEKHGVQIMKSDDCDAYARLGAQTAARDRFRGHSAAHYRAFLQTIPGSFLLLARSKDAPEPIAGLLGVIYGTTGLYYYGASSDAARNLMAPYLLQWEAMRHCKKNSCTRYDLFGIAPEGSTEHPWSGVTDFKAKFGGQYMEYPPEQQIILRPMLKATLDLKRKILG